MFCDGVVFNRLAGLPVVHFSAAEKAEVLSKFAQMRQIVESPGRLARERIISALRDLLLFAAERKIRDISNPDQGFQAATTLSPLVLEFQRLVDTNFHKKPTWHSIVTG